MAQATSTMVGTVQDPTGASIANAQVTVVEYRAWHQPHNHHQSAGEWAVPLFRPEPTTSPSSPRASRNIEVEGVILQVAQKARVDVAHAGGAANTEVTVEGSSVAQVETQSSDLGGTVTGKEITQLQLNGRNFTQLATLVPGVSNQSGQDDAGVGVGGNVAFSMNGGRTEYNNWELDSGDNMDNGSNTTLNVYPSLDAIAEFKVLTSNYGAQYGRNGSGTVEVETKSGTNSFHGDAYEFVRNDVFNAKTFPQNTLPPYKKNDFGYTIGGPVFIPGLYNNDRSKTFFFWSQEWRRERVPANLGSVTVPSLPTGCQEHDSCTPGIGISATCVRDATARLILTTGLPFPGNLVPIDQVNAPALDGRNSPAHQRNQHLECFSNTYPPAGVKSCSAWTTIHRQGSRHVSATSTIPGTRLYPTPLWTNGTSFPTIQTNFGGPGVSMVARLTATVSPTLLNEFVVSYTTDHITLIPVGAWQRPADI